MASLTANVAIASWQKYKAFRMRCDAADEFFRGALLFFLGGQVTPIVTDTTSAFAGR